MDAQAALKIVEDYGKVLEAFAFLQLAPESVLPHDRETIKDAIKTLLPIVSEKQYIEHLRTGYAGLADFVDDFVALDYFKTFVGIWSGNPNHPWLPIKPELQRVLDIALNDYKSLLAEVT